MEEIMFALEVVGVYVFVALSLWVFSRGETEAQWRFMFAAFLGWIMLVSNEYVGILGGVRFGYSIAYLGISAASAAYRLILHLKASSQGQVKHTEEDIRPHDTTGNGDRIDHPQDAALEKAQEILGE